MFYSQPLATRFGTDLTNHIRSGLWDKLDVAVAWIRASGMAHLEPDLKTFLSEGKELSVVVGVDLDNTTKEGLERLLTLEQYGAVSVFVHHNEAGSIFHPKLYLFRNSEKAKLIVGSNNITEAGLYRNTEAGLELEASVGDPIVLSALNALNTWRDISLGLARKLDAAFLADLVNNGYIKDEATVKAEAAARRALSSSAAPGVAKKLFASVAVTPPIKPPATPGTLPSAAHGKTAVGTTTSSPSSAATATLAPTGQVLLMRVRKAHATARPTQTQVPKDVAGSSFFGGTTSVTSVHNGEIHEFRQATARGNINTLKLEIPEMRNMADPVVRFERTPKGIQYEVYDSSTPKGQSIMQALNAGLKVSPASTHLTKPSTPTNSTWWRFI